jgi:hypothetical protein
MRGDTPSIASPNPGASINVMAVGNAKQLIVKQNVIGQCVKCNA